MANETKPYSPQITAEKGVVEGIITTAVAGAVVGFLPNADPAEIAGVVGLVIGFIKMARNWFKNRKGAKQ